MEHFTWATHTPFPKRKLQPAFNACLAKKSFSLFGFTRVACLLRCVLTNSLLSWPNLVILPCSLLVMVRGNYFYPLSLSLLSPLSPLPSLLSLPSLSFYSSLYTLEDEVVEKDSANGESPALTKGKSKKVRKLPSHSLSLSPSLSSLSLSRNHTSSTLALSHTISILLHSLALSCALSLSQS
jgi:hypothetical protein